MISRNITAYGATMLSCGLALSASLSPAWAQSEAESATYRASNALEEITVTARKREESLEGIPIAITAFGSAELENLGVRNLEDLAYFAPGLQFNSQALAEPGRAFTRVRFRGMDLNTTPNPTQEIASVFMDGIYLPGSISSIPIEDLERVEIIRGPQSAMFGRATFGGAVNFVTKTPSMEHSARIMATAAEDADYEVSAAYEGPIIKDRLAIRLGARLYDFGGQYRSGADGGRLGQQSTESLDATLVAYMTEKLTAKLTVRAFEDEDGPAAGFYLGGEDRTCGPFVDPNVPTEGAFSSTAFFCGDLPDVNLSDRGPNTTVTPEIQSIFLQNSLGYAPLDGAPNLQGIGLRRESFFSNLSLEYELGDGWLLTSSTGITDEQTSNLRDFDLSPVSGWWASGPQENESYSQELRLMSPDTGSFNWLIGATGFWQEYATPAAGGLFVLFFPQGDPFIAQNPVGQNEAETLSVYGGASWDISESFTLNIEGRLQRDEVRFLSTAPNSPELKATYETFLPRVILEYETPSEGLLYLSYSEGNRPGGFNPELVAATPDVRDQILALTGAGINIEEEELKSFEVGYKTDVFGGRGFVSASAYYMPWSNQQTRFAVPVVDPGNPASDPQTDVRVVQVTVNAGKTDLWGLELEGSLQLNDNWTFNGNFGWAASEYKNFICLFCARFTGNPDVAGKSVPRFPEFTGALSADYVRPLGRGLELIARADVIYEGDAYVDESNLATREAYWLTNVRAGIQREGLKVELFARNLFDNDAYLGASRNTDFSNFFNFSEQGVVVTPARKRQFGLRVVAQF